ncbi:MAG TPA: ABC transporter permease [Terriglobales bacterium]|nr:ABC transporter permease [Terriglobales bacterium]
MLSRIRSALRNLLDQRQIESELDAEIRSYVDAVADEKIAAGLSPDEARRRALAESGGVEQMKLAVREARAGAGIELLWQDVCYALRQLLRNPVYAWTVMITLGLGIGATTSIFSAVFALLLRPLPYPEPSRLVYISNVFPTGPSYHLPSPEFVAARHGLHSFSQVAGYLSMNANLSGAGDPVRVQWVGVTANLLPMLGISPSLGRDFRADEEKPGGPAVVLLSDRFWRSYFHADPGVVGRSVALEGGVQINGREQTIIGVLPANFSFPDFSFEPEVYSLIDLDPDTSLAVGKQVLAMSSVARLRPGVTPQQAQAEVETFFRARGRTYPAAFTAWWTTRHMVVQSLQRHLTGDDRKPLLILLVSVMAVLLIACANVANLQMARAVSRGHEMAVRGALGASRFRLLRQSLVESLALSVLSAALGLGIAWLMVGLVRHSADIAANLSWRDTARALDLPLAKIGSVIHVDGWVLAFSVSLALLTALLFGLAPAITGARMDLRNALQSAVQRVTAGRQQRLFRHSLLVLEVAVAVVLLSSAGLLMRSFVNVLRYDAGFDIRDTLTGSMLLGHQRYQSLSAQRKFAEQLLFRLEAIPRVQAAALASTVPLEHASADAFSLDNPPHGAKETAPLIEISPDYFRAVGTPLLQGRPFTIDDTATSAPVAIVSRSFDRHYFDGNALGKRLFIGQAVDRGSGLEYAFVATTIVGVAADVRYNGIEHEVEPEFYVPLAQVPNDGLKLILRSDLDTVSLANAMRRAATAVDREQPLFDIQTMEQRVSSLVSRRRLMMLLVAAFAFLAVLLAAVGVYGVFTYSLSLRTREMGIRLALGSSPASLVGIIVAQAARLIGTGSAAGLAAALLSARLLAGMLVGVKVHDPLSFTLAWTLMNAAALLASALPALKAARTDPISVLHAE